MFYKLRKKIFNSIFFVALAFVLILSSISFYAIINSIFNSQAKRANENVVNGVDSCNNHLDTVIGFVDNVATRKSVVQFAKGDVSFYGDVSQLLDGLCVKSTRVDGAMLYLSNGYVVYSSGVGGPPLLEQLQADAGISTFLSSQDISFVSFRQHTMAQTYNKNYYNSSKGIISCMRKVVDDEGNVVGVLVADILPETLYNVRLNYSSFQASSVTFFAQENLYSMPTEFSHYSRKEGITSDGKYYVATSQISNVDVLMFTPLNEYRFNIIIIAVILGSMDILLMSATALFSLHVSESIVKPLDTLYNRMLTEKL